MSIQNNRKRVKQKTIAQYLVTDEPVSEGDPKDADTSSKHLKEKKKKKKLK